MKKILYMILLLPFIAFGQGLPVSLQNGVANQNPVPVDRVQKNLAATSYTNTAQVLSEVPAGRRFSGQIFLVGNPFLVYTFASDADAASGTLSLFLGGGGSGSLPNGSGLTWNGTGYDWTGALTSDALFDGNFNVKFGDVSKIASFEAITSGSQNFISQSGGFGTKYSTMGMNDNFFSQLSYNGISNTLSQAFTVGLQTATSKRGFFFTDGGLSSTKFAINMTDNTWIMNLGSDAPGDIYRRNSSGFFSRLALGSALQTLRVNSGATDIEWATSGSGDMLLGSAQTVTGRKKFGTGTLTVGDNSNTFQYIFASPSNLSADRNINFPLLTATDEFVFKDFTQTLTNKTLTSPKLNSSSTTGYIWTATDNIGNGSWQVGGGGSGWATTGTTTVTNPVISHVGTDGVTFTHNSTSPADGIGLVIEEKINDNGADLDFYFNPSTTAASGDRIYELHGYGNNASGTKKQLTAIYAEHGTLTAGSENGMQLMNITSNGTLAPYFKAQSDGANVGKTRLTLSNVADLRENDASVMLGGNLNAPVAGAFRYDNTTAGRQPFIFSNSYSGAGSYSELIVTNDASGNYTEGMRVICFPTAWGSVGAFKSYSSSLTSGASLTGGLNLVSENSGAPIRFYTGGFLDANERGSFNSSGDFTINGLATGGADQMVTVDTNGKLKKQTISGGGITNSAANNEIMKSDGTNAISSKLYSPSSGNFNLGDAGLSGANRTIQSVGSASDVGLVFLSQGAGPINFTAGGSYSAASDLDVNLTSNTGFINIKNTNVSGTGTAAIKLFEPTGSGTNYNTIHTAAQAVNIDYTLPTTAPPTNGSHIVSSTSGAWSWTEGQQAGSVSQVGTATTTFTVTIGVTMSSSSYKVNVTPTAALSAALFYVTNKTTTTFDVVYLAGLTGTVTFDWVITP